MDNQQLAQSFNSVASEYDKYRTGYPPELIDRILELSPTVPSSCTALEIGCGTGQATLSFAKKGVSVVCVEPGPELIKTAQKNLREFPNISFINSKLEDASIVSKFDLIFAAQSFHWVDKTASYSIVSSLLKPNALFAAFWKCERPKNDNVTQELHNLYTSYLPCFKSETAEEYELGVLSDLTQLVESHKFYGCQLIRLPLPRKTSDAQTYANGLSTWSRIAALPNETKTKLLSEVQDIIKQSGNIVVSETQEITLICGYKK